MALKTWHKVAIAVAVPTVVVVGYLVYKKISSRGKAAAQGTPTQTALKKRATLQKTVAGKTAVKEVKDVQLK